MHLVMRAINCCFAFTLVLILSGCESKPGNFSQYPGFDAWFAANPPSNTPASAEQLALLERYKPRLYVSEQSGPPVRFYEDYIANGELRSGDGKAISTSVDQRLLNQYKDDPGIVFRHKPGVKQTKPQAIVRFDTDSLTNADGEGTRKLLFLSYHFVFAHSGVAAGIRGWQHTLLSWFADPTDWHQLDHYTAVSVVLDAHSRLPVALMLQQHNYLRTWLVGDQEAPGVMAWPSDDRARIVAAVDSNELYRWQEGRRIRRALPGMSADRVHWLIHGTNKPWMTADDITDPQREVRYSLKALAPADAFFVFKGWLGERRITPGRDGPPGADYNTIPALKARATQLASFYWFEGDSEYVDLLQQWPKDRRPSRVDVAPLIKRFSDRLNRAHPPRAHQ
jgi:hypothetical protein